MAITNVRQYFLDTLIEMVGIKSGLAVTALKSIELLDQQTEGHGWWQGDTRDFMRIRGEDLQETFLDLMHLVGAIPDTASRERLIVDFCRKKLKAPTPGSPKDRAVAELSMKLDLALLNHLEHDEPLSKQFVKIPGIDTLMEEISRRDMMIDGFPATADWDGVVPLSKLFKSKDAPSDSSTFFDQRFIDYLNAQGADLAEIHWRQFERLTAEFFRRRGYEVELGPGTKDGGKDIKVIRKRSLFGPELVVVECRRYKKDLSVGLKAVRAFARTIDDEKATKGIIATTTCFTKGERDYCKANLYRLSAADCKRVAKLLKAMKRP